MALKFKTVKAHKSNYGAKRDVADIKYIVLHYTGNKNDSALNNCKYFQGANREASAHYFVDQGAYVYRSVLPNYVAWAVGGYYNNNDGGAKYYKKCTNANSLSIEMCDSVDKVPAKTYETVVELVKFLMKKYNVPASRVINHNLVNGKHCPAPWVGENNKAWKQFKKDIVAKPKPFALGEYNAMAKALVNAPIRAKRNAASKKLGTLKAGEKIKVIKISKTATGTKWAKVKHDDGYGFIYLKKLEPCL